MKHNKVGFCVLFGLCLASVLVFQNCGQFKLQENSKSLKVNLNNYSVESITYDEVLNQGSVDLVDYFIGSNIRDGLSNFVFSRIEEVTGNDVIFSVTKFNEPNNIEVYSADDEFIYIRYESTRESYGGIENVVRRFQTTTVQSNQIAQGVQSYLGNPGRGGIWARRNLEIADIGKPMLTSYAFDVYNFTPGGQTPELLTQFSTSSSPMVIWHNLERVSSTLPFVMPEFQPDHKLVLSQQWSACNIEEYEYARGVGYVGWRSLVSTHADCTNLLRGPQNSKKMIKNYIRGGQEELFVVVQGMAIDSPMDNQYYNNRVEPSFEVSGVFLDDYPYYYTSANSYLDGLRTNGNTPEVPNYDEVVTRLFLEILKREPDTDGLNYYVSLMMAGASVEEISNRLRESNEFKIGELYRLHLLRDPDADGLQFYLNLMESGFPESGVKRDLQESSDCLRQCIRQQTTPSPTPTPTPASTPNPTPVNYIGIVREVYLQVLKRPADPDGLGYYVGLMKSGTSRDQVKRLLELSDEFKIGEFYRLHLLRDPDVAGMAFYLDHVKNGLSLNAVKQDIQKSPECKRFCL